LNLAETFVLAGSILSAVLEELEEAENEPAHSN
jgi:hypothetical protein